MCKIKPPPLKSSFNPFSIKFCTWKTSQDGLHLWTLSASVFCLTGGSPSGTLEGRGAWSQDMDFSSSLSSGWPLRKISKEPSQWCFTRYITSAYVHSLAYGRLPISLSVSAPSYNKTSNWITVQFILTWLHLERPYVQIGHIHRFQGFWISMYLFWETKFNPQQSLSLFGFVILLCFLFVYNWNNTTLS